ncbi:reverse transcriptase [Lasius niger]|uniref:Reverse transcriptase n=1 Tax=Lasius niger TaxID=67767 RepID=A0A0J7KGK1_LASNI|nr:reverse transcriptase [Lasius niger]
MNEILADVPGQVGYCIMGHNVNALAFADDLVLIGATRDGAQRSLVRVIAALHRFGLESAPTKCAAFSLVPSGKTKKIKTVTDPQFVAGDRPIPQLGVFHTVRYLGVQFGETGPVIQGVELLPLLERITRTPLKPQQRLKILKTYLIPRIRTTRGSRQLREDVSCRGGCRVQETAAQVVQQCFRTHRGRIMRHDAVASTLAGEFQRGSYSVHREHVFRTCEGVRKPDIVAAKGVHGHVLDVQIISGARPLSDGHNRKRNYYANNVDLLSRVGALLQVPAGQDSATSDDLFAYVYEFPGCGRNFSTKTGKGVHHRRAHPDWFDAQPPTTGTKAR